jgi:hypothetical protein
VAQNMRNPAREEGRLNMRYRTVKESIRVAQNRRKPAPGVPGLWQREPVRGIPAWGPSRLGWVWKGVSATLPQPSGESIQVACVLLPECRHEYARLTSGIEL